MVLHFQESAKRRQLIVRQVPELESARIMPVQMAVLQEVLPTLLVQLHLGSKPYRSERGPASIDPAIPFVQAAVHVGFRAPETHCKAPLLRLVHGVPVVSSGEDWKTPDAGVPALGSLVRGSDKFHEPGCH